MASATSSTRSLLSNSFCFANVIREGLASCGLFSQATRRVALHKRLEAEYAERYETYRKMAES